MNYQRPLRKITNPEEFCVQAWLSSILMARPFSEAGIMETAAQDGFDPILVKTVFGFLKESGEIIHVGGEKYMDKDTAPRQNRGAWLPWEHYYR